MTVTSAVSTTSMPLVPPRLAEPPPATLELRDGDIVVGWVMGAAIGFRGFANEAEAAHAAWVAHRTLERRRARAEGGRPVPVDVEPLSLDRSREPAVILAGGRPIGTLVVPGTGSRSGTDSFGFELPVPAPADELRARSSAHLVYRTLRRAGLRWALFTRRSPQPVGVVDARSTAAQASEAGDARRASPRDVPGGGWGLALASSAGISLLALGLLVVARVRAITAPAAVGMLGAVAAVFALVALAALLQLVLAELRVRRCSSRGHRPQPGHGDAPFPTLEPEG